MVCLVIVVDCGLWLFWVGCCRDFLLRLTARLANGFGLRLVYFGGYMLGLLIHGFGLIRLVSLSCGLLVLVGDDCFLLVMLVWGRASMPLFCSGIGAVIVSIVWLIGEFLGWFEFG